MKFFRTVVQSFYSVPLYEELRARPGYGLRYSFFLVLFTSMLIGLIYLPFVHRAHQELFVGVDGKMPVMDDLFAQIARQSPAMVYENATLRTVEPGKHIIHLSTDFMGAHLEGDMITVDTSGATTADTTETPMLVTANSVIIRSEKETRIRPFTVSDETANMRLELDSQSMQQALDQVGQYVRGKLPMFYAAAGSLLYLCFAVAMYAVRICFMLLLGLIGMLAGKLMHSPVSYRTAMRFSAVSFTPTALLSLMVTFAIGGVVTPLQMFLCGIVTLVASLYVSRPQEV